MAFLCFHIFNPNRHCTISNGINLRGGMINQFKIKLVWVWKDITVYHGLSRFVTVYHDLLQLIMVYHDCFVHFLVQYGTIKQLACFSKVHWLSTDYKNNLTDYWFFVRSTVTSWPLIQAQLCFACIIWPYQIRSDWYRRAVSNAFPRPKIWSKGGSKVTGDPTVKFFGLTKKFPFLILPELFSSVF